MGERGSEPDITCSLRCCEYRCVPVHVSVQQTAVGGLAYTLVCVNVALTVGAGVCHILEVVNQTGNQAAAQVATEKEEQG